MEPPQPGNRKSRDENEAVSTPGWGDTGGVGKWKYLRHNDVLPSQPVVWIRIMVIDGRNRDVSPLAEVPHCGHFGIGFKAGHKSPRNAGDDFPIVG